MSTMYATVDAYDSSLTLSNPTALSVGRDFLRGTRIGNYALFGGGDSASTSVAVNTVDAYSASLTRTTATPLTNPVRYHTAVPIDEFALFAGGQVTGTPVDAATTYTATVNVYDTSLTKTTTTNLSTEKDLLISGVVGNYALIAGGQNTAGNPWQTVDVYQVI